MTGEAPRFYGPRTPRIIMSVMVAGFWGVMAIEPGAYTSGTYAVAFRYATPREWGVALFAAGVAMAVTRAVWPVAIVGGLLAVWCAALLAAVFTGESQSPAGSFFLGGYVGLLIWGTGQPSIGGTVRRRKR